MSERIQKKESGGKLLDSLHKDGFLRLQDIVRVLRSEQGCPWDRTQTHESLETCLIEEACEAAEGIHILSRTGEGDNLCEELGDVLFQVVFHSRLAEEEGIFTLEDVLQGINDKMIRRHPHVFGDAETVDWEAVKREEKRGKTDPGKVLEKQDEEAILGNLLHQVCRMADRMGLDKEKILRDYAD